MYVEGKVSFSKQNVHSQIIVFFLFIPVLSCQLTVKNLKYYIAVIVSSLTWTLRRF